MKNYIPVILGLSAIYILYRVSKSLPNNKAEASSKTDAKENFDGKKLNYTGGGGGGHHHGGGGGWRNPYIMALPYYPYGSYYPYFQPDVCYTKTKTGKLLAHYCNDIM